jgi:phosphopantothenoylcysteine decarboxylase/phosphopantothenate--cysteine ligase
MRKGLDLIVANDVSGERTGIGSDVNAALVLSRSGVVADLPVMPKRAMADRILDLISAHCVPPKV